MRRKDGSDGKNDPPTDIRTAIVMTYTNEMSAEDIAENLRIEMEKSESLKSILDREDREHILSANLVIEAVGNLLQNDEACRNLCKHFPSVTSWANATDPAIAKHLDDRDALLAPVIRARVMEALELS